MKREIYLAVDSLRGPFETLAEAEFFAEDLQNTLTKHGKRRRRIQIVEKLREVK